MGVGVPLDCGPWLRDCTEGMEGLGSEASLSLPCFLYFSWQQSFRFALNKPALWTPVLYGGQGPQTPVNGRVRQKENENSLALTNFSQTPQVSLCPR